AQREELHTLVMQGLATLTDRYFQQGDYAAGLTMTQRWLQLEPWHETAHRQQMRLLAASGRTREALAQYAVCQRRLVEELNSPPSAEAVALYAAIRAGEFNTEKDAPAKTTAPGPAPLPTNTPKETQVNWSAVPAVPKFYGREPELTQLQRWLVH